MNTLMLIAVVSVLFLLCFAGFAIGLIIRNKNMNNCGCGRAHDHSRESGCCSDKGKSDACCQSNRS